MDKISLLEFLIQMVFEMFKAITENDIYTLTHPPTKPILFNKDEGEE